MSKIRTLAELQDHLDREYSWRIKEIATLKVVAKGSSSLNQSTVIRAGLPLVYAHWEGFVKRSSESYLKYVTSQRLKYEELTSCFIVFGAKKYLANIVGSRKSVANIEAVEFFRSRLADRADLSLSNAIDTKSNLNSETFENIALSIGVSTIFYDAHYKLIDESLLARRNGIAHGEYLDLDAIGFRSLSDEVIKLLRQYKTDIENLASTAAFRTV